MHDLPAQMLVINKSYSYAHSQWKYVRRSKQRRTRPASRFWKQTWGRYVVEQIRVAVTEGEWKRATQGMLSLLRYSPFCLASMLNDYLLPRKAVELMRRRTPQMSSGALHCLKCIRAKIVTCLKSNDIVVSLTLLFGAMRQFRK